MLNSPMSIILGIIILCFLAFDMLSTIVQASEGIASRMAQLLAQRLLYGLYRLTGKRVFLVWSSSLLILSLVTMWVILLYLGWFFIFLGDSQAVLRGKDETIAGIGERVYFTGFTISTLGVGDYIPNGVQWQFITAICALSGFFFLTFIISFLQEVAEKQALRRKLALHIHHSGPTPQALIVNYWNAGNNTVLTEVIDTLLSDVVQFEQQHLDQPILNRFHGPSEERSVELALVVLDEAMTLAEIATQTNLPPHFQHMRRAITGYLGSLRRIKAETVDTPPPIPNLTPLYQVGIPLEPRAAIEATYAKLAVRRCKLAALISSTGWTWQKVVEPDAI